MWKELLDFFVPSYHSEDEAMLVENWLRAILLVILSFLSIYIVLQNPFRAWGLEIWFNTALFVFYSGLLFFLKQQHIRWISNLLAFSALAALMAAAYVFGGIRSASYTSLFVTIVLAAVFLRVRVAVFFCIVISVYGLLLALAEKNGYYSPNPFYLQPLHVWLGDVFSLLILTVLIGLTSKNVRAQFDRTMREMQERRYAENTLRQQAEYLKVLHQTTFSMMNRRELMPLLESILSEVEKLCNTPHGYIHLYIDQGNTAHQIVGHGIFDEVLDSKTRSNDITGLISPDKDTVIINEYSTWEKCSLELVSQGVSAMVALPLLAEDRLLGVLGLCYTDGRRFSQQQASTLEQYSKLAALGIYNAQLYEAANAELKERKRAELALLESQQQLELALESARIGFLDWNILTDDVILSEQLYRMYGLQPEQFGGQTSHYFALIHPEDRGDVQKQFNECIDGGTDTYQLEHRFFASDQVIGWMQTRGRVIRDAGGRALRMISSVADITEQKLSEIAIRQANKNLEHSAHTLTRRSALLQLGAEVSRAATAILKPGALGQQVVDLVQKSFGLYFVGLYLLSDDMQWAVLHAGTGDAARQMLAENWQLSMYTSSMVAWCIANRKSRIALDVGEDAVRFSNPLLADTRSELALPLVSRNRVLGALTIQSAEPSAFSQEDISALETMADQLANAILNAELYDQLEKELEERKRVEDQIRQLNSELEARVERRTRALRASEEKFRALTENNPVRIRRFDLEGHYLYANHIGEGEDIPSASLIGKRLRDVLTDSDLVELSEASIRRVFLTSKPLNLEYKFGENYASWWLAPEFGPDGNVVSVVTSAIDITERKHMEDALQQKTQELEVANRELEAFSYSVSHDLRAPLRAIDGFTRILFDDYAQFLPDAAKTYLNRSRMAAQDMSRLIDDMLRLSRITRAELRLESLNLADIAYRISETLQNRDPERNIQIDIQDDLQTVGDAGLLQVAMENLMNNAWKFTGKTQPARIEVGKLQQDNTTVFFIRDNGVGFDMKFSKKLFGTFQRLHKSEEFPGTGVGLAIVLRVISKHGGRIWAESQVGNGATFFFTLDS